MLIFLKKKKTLLQQLGLVISMHELIEICGLFIQMRCRSRAWLEPVFITLGTSEGGNQGSSLQGPRSKAKPSGLGKKLPSQIFT